MTRFLYRTGWVYLVLIGLFMLAPALIVFLDSVNSSKSFPAPLESLTLRWYGHILDEPEFVHGFTNSVIVAVSAALCALVIGFLAAYALVRYRVRGGTAIATILMSPLLVPDIIVGVAALQMFRSFDFDLNLTSLVVVHAVFFLAIAVRLILTGLARFDFNLEDAAASLGANRWRTIWNVTLPIVRPSLIAGCMLVFILSFVNLPLSMFLTTPDSSTLPVIMFAYIESRIDPLIACVASLIALMAAALIFFIEGVLRVRLLG